MYQALYRKYRPISFEEVYGQEIAKKILINALKTNKISHAYLFYGPRGTGKTSIAKMFARIVNCSERKEEKPCNICNNCTNALEKECVDIIEIDAASNNGVDEIRELKSKINMVPSLLKYKVYIIDEVHMLSTGAFNALLKTLEEPPEHIIFILATTEFYKVPVTIISRCQTIEFKNIDDNNLKLRIKEISNFEKILIKDDAITEIVKNSNGDLRKAIGLLDKVQSYCENEVFVDDVKKIVGTISSGEIINFVDEYELGELNKLLEKIELYADTGYDLIRIINDIVVELRNRMLIKNDYTYMDKINKIINYQEKIKSNENKKILFEMAIIDTVGKTNVRENISREIFFGEEKEKKEEKTIDFINVRINNAFFDANKKLLFQLKSNWQRLETYLFDADLGAIICSLVESVPTVCGEKNLVVVSEYDSNVKKINRNLNIIEEIIEKAFGKKYNLIAISNEQWEKYRLEYLHNLKEGKKYKYIEEMNYDKLNEEKENSIIVDQAISLFGNIVS